MVLSHLHVEVKILNNACSIPYSTKLGAISKADSEVYRLESCPSAR